MRFPTTQSLSSNTLRKICIQNHTLPTKLNPSSIPSPSPNYHAQKLIESRIISLLDICKHHNHVKELHAHLYQSGLEKNSYILTKFIRILTKLNSPMADYPRSIFNQVHDPDPFLYTALIRGYVFNGSISESIVLYGCMRKNGVIPNSFTFCTLFKGCTYIGYVGLGRQLHGQMVKFGGSGLFLHGGNSLIDLYVKCGFLENARKVFDEMSERDVISGTSLIVAYAKGGEMEAATELFDELDVKDVVVWTAMITSNAQNARPKEALEMFERMQCCGIKADEFTLAGVISSCAQLGTIKYASCIRDIAERSGHGPDRNVVIGSALVDMYAKCGRVDDAYGVFEMMRERNVYSYSSMILGFAVHGRASEAMRLFYEMERGDVRVRPNGVTFLGVLTACSHVGMVEEGRRLFGSMEEKYGVSPTSDHYTCMVDLLGRSGHLEEALALARSMPLKPHGSVWGALLGACSIYNNPDIAEIAASHLFELEPHSIGNYVVLANILSSAGRWDRVSIVRNMMRRKGLKKYPARSWVEGKKGSVHEFFAGDQTHPMYREMKQVLEDLLYRLKLHGYEPNLRSVSYDISDDDKRQILMAHSEKLALAFELLTTESTHTIRIMKNLRICEDCHIFMCGASKITGREIVIRDNMRFHHFHDGACSCGNFW